jgi:hypothetical protein
MPGQLQAGKGQVLVGGAGSGVAAASARIDSVIVTESDGLKLHTYCFGHRFPSSRWLSA